MSLGDDRTACRYTFAKVVLEARGVMKHKLMIDRKLYCCKFVNDVET